MLTKRTLGSAVAMSAILLGAAALADPQVTERPESASALGTKDPSTIALTDVTARIEAKTHGRVMDIRYQDWNGKGAYDAVVARGDQVSTVRMEARTGKMMRVASSQTPDWALNWEKRADIRSAKKAMIPLSAAIRTAEDAAHAPAFEAGFAKPLTPDSDVLAYNVELMLHGQPQLMAVDATTNEVIANPSALGLPDHDASFILSRAQVPAAD